MSGFGVSQNMDGGESSSNGEVSNDIEQAIALLSFIQPRRETST